MKDENRQWQIADALGAIAVATSSFAHRVLQSLLCAVLSVAPHLRVRLRSPFVAGNDGCASSSCFRAGGQTAMQPATFGQAPIFSNHNTRAASVTIPTTSTTQWQLRTPQLVEAFLLVLANPGVHALALDQAFFILQMVTPGEWMIERIPFIQTAFAADLLGFDLAVAVFKLGHYSGQKVRFHDFTPPVTSSLLSRLFVLSLLALCLFYACFVVFSDVFATEGHTPCMLQSWPYPVTRVRTRFCPSTSR